jgi:hypothetical protein
MENSSICDKETKMLNKFYNLQLANSYKKLGYYIAFGTFVIMIAKKFFEEPDWVKPTLKVLLLTGMLVISLSKDKVEDELIDSLRSKSYRLAFIMGVLYTLVQPIVNFAVGSVLNEDAELVGFDYFQILFFMLLVQLMMFWQLKRFYR